MGFSPPNDISSYMSISISLPLSSLPQRATKYYHFLWKSLGSTVLRVRPLGLGSWVPCVLILLCLCVEASIPNGQNQWPASC